MADDALRGEFREGDLSDQCRLHPVRAAGFGAWRFDRRLLDLDPAQLFAQILEGRHREARSGLAGVAELLVLMDGEEQRAQRPALALARRPADDDEFLAIGAFDLQPVRSEEHTSELQSLMRISYSVF